MADRDYAKDQEFVPSRAGVHTLEDSESLDQHPLSERDFHLIGFLMIKKGKTRIAHILQRTHMISKIEPRAGDWNNFLVHYDLIVAPRRISQMAVDEILRKMKDEGHDGNFAYRYWTTAKENESAMGAFPPVGYTQQDLGILAGGADYLIDIPILAWTTKRGDFPSRFHPWFEFT